MGHRPRPRATWDACLPATPWRKLEGDGWGVRCSPGIQSLRAWMHVACGSSEGLRCERNQGPSGPVRTAIAKSARDHGGRRQGAGRPEAPTSVQLSGRTGARGRTPVPAPPPCPGPGCAVQEGRLQTRPLSETPWPLGNEAVAQARCPPRTAGGSQAPQSLEDMEIQPTPGLTGAHGPAPHGSLGALRSRAEQGLPCHPCRLHDGRTTGQRTSSEDTPVPPLPDSPGSGRRPRPRRWAREGCRGRVRCMRRQRAPSPWRCPPETPHAAHVVTGLFHSSRRVRVPGVK